MSQSWETQDKSGNVLQFLRQIHLKNFLSAPGVQYSNTLLSGHFFYPQRFFVAFESWQETTLFPIGISRRNERRLGDEGMIS